MRKMREHESNSDNGTKRTKRTSQCSKIRQRLRLENTRDNSDGIEHRKGHNNKVNVTMTRKALDILAECTVNHEQNHPTRIILKRT